MMGLRLGSREELTAQWGQSTSNHQSWFIKSTTPCSLLPSHIGDCEVICNSNSVIISPVVLIHISPEASVSGAVERPADGNGNG